MRAPLGWAQLKHRPMRLVVAVAGVAFAVLLIMMQLGFRSALFESAVRFHERFDYDIALFSPDSVFIVRPEDFSVRRVYQALSDDQVTAAYPIHIFPAIWKNPWTNQRRSINAIGFDPEHPILETRGFERARAQLTQQNVVAFDVASRPEFGAVGAALADDGPFVTEINDRTMEVVAGFEMGSSFGIDGTIMMSTDNWLRIFPGKPRERVHLGLLKLAADADPDEVRARLADYLPDDVLVMTKPEFIARETAYWNSATPIGYIFAFGAIMGFVVGGIIVYQILFADVSEHLHEYATLRALGYGNGFVSGIVLQQAGILAVLGYLPGLAAAHSLYGLAAGATKLPLYVTPDRALSVLVLTLTMCAVSALLAVRKVRRLDPAEVF